MELHRILGDPGAEITCKTDHMAGVQLSQTWSPYAYCFKARVQCHVVPTSNDNRVDRPAGKFFVDLSGPFHETPLGGKRFMFCVD